MTVMYTEVTRLSLVTLLYRVTKGPRAGLEPFAGKAKLQQSIT